MKIRTFTMTLIITLTLWLLTTPILTGCGEEQISNSNTNSVENVRRSGSLGEGSGSPYASMD